MEEKRTIEINGIKMEVDLRTCKVIDSFKVGDKVKLLVKTYSEFKSHAGVIIGFDAFVERPTIIVAYLDENYNTSSLKFCYINKESKDAEMVPANENDIPFTKEAVLIGMDNLIERKRRELEDEITKKEAFLKWFGKYFES